MYSYVILLQIKNRYQTYRSMKWFTDWRRRIRNSANKIQQWAFFRMWTRNHRVEVAFNRIQDESRLAGEKLYAKTEFYAQVDEVCICTKTRSYFAPALIFSLCVQLYKRVMASKIPLAKHEPQSVFMSYCPQGLLDMGKAFKMVKECPGLIHPPQLTMKTVEMIFAKVSSFCRDVVS